MKPVIDVLYEAKQLLVTKGWTHGTFARDANGYPTDLRSPAAVAFCATGALIAVGGAAAFHALLHALFGASSGPSWHAIHFGDWNDAPGRTKEEVLALFDKAMDEVTR